jgi:hypothetical protein
MTAPGIKVSDPRRDVMTVPAAAATSVAVLGVVSVRSGADVLTGVHAAVSAGLTRRGSARVGTTR